MPGPIDKPAAEVAVTEDLVRHLLGEHHPDLADLPLVPLDAGWDNALFRLGEDLVVRVPRRELGAVLVEHEVRWLPELAPSLPLPVPVPVRVGGPTSRYPWDWTVVPWMPGATALRTPPADPLDAAERLAEFLVALHVPAAPAAPRNDYRGVPLAARDEATRERIAELDAELDAATATRCWEDHLAVAPWTGPALWLHGDLHPNNVVVDGGAVSGVIDFGDLTGGDPATDLMVAWFLLPRAARDRFRAVVGADDDTWHRSRAWALSVGLAYLLHSADDPDFGRCGRSAIATVLEDWRAS